MNSKSGIGKIQMYTQSGDKLGEVENIEVTTILKYNNLRNDIIETRIQPINISGTMNDYMSLDFYETMFGYIKITEDNNYAYFAPHWMYQYKKHKKKRINKKYLKKYGRYKNIKIVPIVLEYSEKLNKYIKFCYMSQIKTFKYKIVNEGNQLRRI